MSRDSSCPIPAQPVDAGAAIDALRERGAHRLDPIRFRFIEALARRAQAYGGEARRLLDGRLATLLAGYGEQVDKACLEAGEAIGEGRARRGALADLIEHIDRQASQSDDGRAAHDAVAKAGPPTELKTARYFRSTWSKLSIDRRLRQSQAKLQENAGPLHSHGLVLRSLESMRGLSPQYLDRFMLYVDALLWLEQANGGGAPQQKDVVRAEGDRKRKAGRGKS